MSRGQRIGLVVTGTRETPGDGRRTTPWSSQSEEVVVAAEAVVGTFLGVPERPRKPLGDRGAKSNCGRVPGRSRRGGPWFGFGRQIPNPRP